MFDHEGPAVVSAMHDLTVGVFDHLDITSSTNVDRKVAYTQRILRVAALKKYRAVLVEQKQSDKELTGDKWELGELKGLSADYLWYWEKKDIIVYDGHEYLGIDKCADF